MCSVGGNFRDGFHDLLIVLQTKKMLSDPNYHKLNEVQILLARKQHDTLGHW